MAPPCGVILNHLLSVILSDSEESIKTLRVNSVKNLIISVTYVPPEREDSSSRLSGTQNDIVTQSESWEENDEGNAKI